VPIRILEPDIATLIAAGEVVERPVSVVKELVENCIDAYSKNISVEIIRGGLDLIKVVDDGVGIPEHETALAFERFATSKIVTEENLDRILTLGFRGEALPSIAAVSDVTLISRPDSQDHGFKVEVEHGSVRRATVHGSPNGTSIEVRYLFQRVPARLKFLGSARSESSKVQSILHQYALAYPDVKFQLIVDGRIRFISSGSGNMRDAWAAVYDSRTARLLLDLDFPEVSDTSEGLLKVEGLISPSDVSRSSRSYIHLFVNGRWIQNRSMMFAIEQAYRGFLIERRYPIAILSISIAPEDVDVNVHPAKLEIRFRNEREIFSRVQSLVRQTLIRNNPVSLLGSRPSVGRPNAPVRADADGRNAFNEYPSMLELNFRDQETQTPREVVPLLQVVGQVKNLYIVAEKEDGLYLVDQHAAHERVLYERISDRFERNIPDVQGLLDPVVVELPTGLSDLLESQENTWIRYGFDIEHFGTDAYILRSVPSALSRLDPTAILTSLLEEVSHGSIKSSADIVKGIAMSIACHSSVRAGKKLAHDEMTNLLSELEMTLIPGACPHGRPTMVHITFDNLERQFGRR
jgi:DNA mismatch repair protein MutL